MIGTPRDLYRKLGYLARHPGRSISADMNLLVDYLESQSPLAIWSDMRAVEFDRSMTAIRRWFAGVIASDPPPREMNGLWFGIFHPYLDSGECITELYVAGSEYYTSTDAKAQWACDLDYRPRDGYADCEALHEIYRLLLSPDGAPDDELFEAEEPLGLGFVMLALSRLLPDYTSDRIVSGSELIGIAFGFDEGDLLPLGELRPDGFRLTFAW